MLIDSHIHVGQFYDMFFSPAELKNFLDSVGVESFAASSTSICEGKYNNVLAEIKGLRKLCCNRFFPVLWILPQMLNDGGLELFLNSGIQWRCLKIHPQLHPEAWLPDIKELGKVLSLANDLEVPFLIHTGEKEGCYPSLYEKAFSEHPNVTFILAHGRPIEETIEMMKEYPNVWCDTAFMPTENILKLCNEDFLNRVLWGSDYPIPRYYYPNIDMKEYYKNKLDSFKSNSTKEQFEQVTCVNAMKLFKNEQ